MSRVGLLPTLVAHRSIEISLLFLLTTTQGWAQKRPPVVTPPAADALAATVQELREELRELRVAVTEMRSEAAQYRAETVELQRELQETRAQMAASSDRNAASQSAPYSNSTPAPKESAGRAQANAQGSPIGDRVARPGGEEVADAVGPAITSISRQPVLRGSIKSNAGSPKSHENEFAEAHFAAFVS